MKIRIPSSMIRWLPYFGLPLAVLMVIAGQSRQDSSATPATSGHAPQTASSTLTELPEFQAVTDRTTELGPEEMPAYWRLLDALEDQPTDKLIQDSLPCNEVAHLLQTPRNFRGTALQLTLNVRRVLDYEVTDSTQQFNRLYEVWGWLDGAPEQLVVVVTPKLPEGIGVGATVYERATVWGYFFKLQGYLPAGAETHMSPLAAPLLIGCLEKCRQPQFTFAHNQDWWRLGASTLLVLSLVGSFSRRSRVKPNTPPVLQSIDTAKTMDLENWLEQASK